MHDGGNVAGAGCWFQSADQGLFARVRLVTAVRRHAATMAPQDGDACISATRSGEWALMRLGDVVGRGDLGR